MTKGSEHNPLLKGMDFSDSISLTGDPAGAWGDVSRGAWDSMRSQKQSTVTNKRVLASAYEPPKNPMDEPPKPDPKPADQPSNNNRIEYRRGERPPEVPSELHYPLHDSYESAPPAERRDKVRDESGGIHNQNDERSQMHSRRPSSEESTVTRNQVVAAQDWRARRWEEEIDRRSPTHERQEQKFPRQDEEVINAGKKS